MINFYGTDFYEGVGDAGSVNIKVSVGEVNSSIIKFLLHAKSISALFLGKFKLCADF